MCIFGAASGTASAEINDEALLFSAATVQRANALVEDIKRNTNPPKEIVVRTVPALPWNEGDPRAFAERLFRAEKLQGVLVLIVKKPAHLVVTSKDRTLSRFKDSAKIQSTMLEEFKGERFNSGLLTGLVMLRNELVEVFPTGKKTQPEPAVAAVVKAQVPDTKTSWPMPKLPSFDRFFFGLLAIALFMVFPWHIFGGKRAAFSGLYHSIAHLPSSLKGSRLYQNLLSGDGSPAGKPKK